MRRAARSVSTLDGATFAIDDVAANPDWPKALAGVECIAHLAAGTHVLRETATYPLAEYRRVNVDGTRRLAEHVAAAGSGSAGV